MPLEIRVDVSAATKSLLRLNERIEERVMESLDESAALVANHAKTDHPRLPARLLEAGASRVSIDAFRVRNWANTGEYAGSYRFLTQTGVLRNSILPRRARRTSRGLVAEVVSGVEYANQVEFGTVDRRAFPFMRPALEANRNEIVRRLKLAVRGGIG